MKLFYCVKIYLGKARGQLKSWYSNICANGPAIWGGCVTRRKHRAESWYFSCETVTVQGGYGTCFCHPGTNFIEHYACRGTSLISETDLSRCNKCYKVCTCAVSRYKFDRSQKSVTVQDLNCVQMRVSGCKNYYKFVLGVGVKAKTVTNNLPILSVLAFVHILKLARCKEFVTITEIYQGYKS
jgi:hypothetical protein